MHCTQFVIVVAVALTFVAGEQVFAQNLSTALKAENSESLAKAAREQGDAVNGALLFTQQKLGCTNCHQRGGGDPLGPDLTALGEEVADTHLVESLLTPSKVIRKGFEAVVVSTKSGKLHTGRIIVDSPDELILRDTSPQQQRITLSRAQIDEVAPSRNSYMPDGLVDLLKDRQQFLDLVRYVMEITAPRAKHESALAASTAGGDQIDEALQGLVLMDRFQCYACHKIDVAPSMAPPKLAPNLAWGNGRIDPNYVERFIADPAHVKPGTTMPDVMAAWPPDQRAEAAREITHYIASLTEKTFRRQSLDRQAAARGNEWFHSVGCVACHAPRGKEASVRIADDSIPLAALDQKFNLEGLIAFLENPHQARASGRMPNMQLSHWEAVDIANFLLAGPEADSEARVNHKAESRFQLDAILAEAGRVKFRQLSCDRCHATEEHPARRVEPALTAENSSRGCLSESIGPWPGYDLNASQRKAIRAAIARGPKALDDREQILVTLTAFNCVACHQRGALGGVAPERDEYFQTTDPNLGPQGRIPPPLTGVGAKLTPTWMRQVLVSGRAIRPYIQTRMPQYGAENVGHLVDLFQRVDRLPEAPLVDFADQKEMRKIGADLVGTGGLNCIVCHTFQLKKAANMSAVDLTEMAERLQKDWFYHYMRDPQRLSRNTIMPSFWPGGRAMRRDVLDGSTDLQIEALWQYLLDGRQAPTPRGLIVEPLELLATDEAVMLRRSYPGIGKRGIGVGYPHPVNLAFDAEQMRLAMIWKGKFADPGGVWRSQGHGTVRPLGDSLIRFAPGADLDYADHPWIVDEGRPPRHRFRGYSLDEKMRPRFHYQFADIRVEDYPIDVVDPSNGQPFLRRTVTLASTTGGDNLVFRAATGKTIQRGDDGLFVVDRSLQVRVDPEHTGVIAAVEDGQQLRIPLPILNGSARLTLEYRW